jgi:hypothetical protein
MFLKWLARLAGALFRLSGIAVCEDMVRYDSQRPRDALTGDRELQD